MGIVQVAASHLARRRKLVRQLEADAAQSERAEVLQDALPRPLRLLVEHAVAQGVHVLLSLVVWWGGTQEEEGEAGAL